MNSRERWVTDTREAVGRALALEYGVPMSAGALYGNLDCDHWSFGGAVTRSPREISAALGWMEREGLAERLPRTEYDPPGVCFVLTADGHARWQR